MKLAIQSFKGVAPKINPRYLADGAAQVALNVEALGQSVKPLKGLGTPVATLSLAGTIRTIYRYGMDYAGEDKYWFRFPALNDGSTVDICRSQIAGDSDEWTFWTGDVNPRATYKDLATAGSSYPAQSMRLGLAAPTVAPTVAPIPDPPEVEPAKVTIPETGVQEVDTIYGVQCQVTEGTTAYNWLRAYPTGTAPFVILQQKDIKTFTGDFGLDITVDGGLNWAHVPLTYAQTSPAGYAQVNVTAAMLDRMYTYGSAKTIYVISGTRTISYTTILGPALPGELSPEPGTNPATISYFIEEINRKAGQLIQAKANTDGLTAIITAKDAGVTLRVYAYDERVTNPPSHIPWDVSDTGAPAQSDLYITDIIAAINATRLNGEQIALAERHLVANIKVTAKGYQYDANGQPVLADRAGGRVHLMVRWSEIGAEEKWGVPLTATSIATAINNLTAKYQDNVTKQVKGTASGNTVLIETGKSGADQSLQVRWGPADTQFLSDRGYTEDQGTPETRVYTYTQVFYARNGDLNGFTWESQPFSVEDMEPYTCTVVAGQDVNITVPAFTDSGNDYLFAATAMRQRIYRSVNGTFLYVGETSRNGEVFLDDVDADALGEACPSITWEPPPAGLRGLINLPNGMMAGFVGRDVYFCEPYRPYAWPSTYNLVVDYPVVGLGRMDTTLVVLTKGVPYFMQGASPDMVTVVKSDLEQACVCKSSVVSMNGAVLYASPDGLVLLTSGSQSVIVTEKLFSRDQWQHLLGSDPTTTFRAYGHDNKYIAFHRDVTETLNGVTYTYRGFMFDTQTGQFVRHDIANVTAGYQDLRNDKLYLAQGSSVVAWGEGANLAGKWRSKKFSLPQITGFTCGQLEAESYDATLKCRLYRDGIKHGTELTNDQVSTLNAARLEPRYPFRVEAKQGRDWEIDLDVTKEIFHVALAQSPWELAS